MINAKRGETLWTFRGRDYRLCLTLGTLAELEHHFASGGIAELGERLGQGSLSSRDVIALLAAGLRGAGEAMDRAALEALPVSEVLPDALDSIAAMLQAAFGEAQEGEGTRGPFPGRR